jgi:hypothetical protein
MDFQYYHYIRQTDTARDNSNSVSGTFMVFQNYLYIRKTHIVRVNSCNGSGNLMVFNVNLTLGKQKLNIHFTLYLLCGWWNV